MEESSKLGQAPKKTNLDHESGFWEDGTEPAGQMAADVVDFARVLAASASRAIVIGLVNQYLNSTSLSISLLQNREEKLRKKTDLFTQQIPYARASVCEFTPLFTPLFSSFALYVCLSN